MQGSVCNYKDLVLDLEANRKPVLRGQDRTDRTVLARSSQQLGSSILDKLKTVNRYEGVDNHFRLRLWHTLLISACPHSKVRLLVCFLDIFLFRNGGVGRNKIHFMNNEFLFYSNTWVVLAKIHLKMTWRQSCQHHTSIAVCLTVCICRIFHRHGENTHTRQ